MAEHHSGIYETSWLWRRLVTIGVLVVCHLIVGGIVWFQRDADTLKWIGLALVAEAVVAYTAYIMGATVTEWAKVAAAAVPGIKIGPTGVTAEPTPPKPPRPEQGPPSP